MMKSYGVDVTEMTTEHKAAENPPGEMCAIIEKVDRERMPKVIAFTADASGARWARRLLREKLYSILPRPAGEFQDIAQL